MENAIYMAAIENETRIAEFENTIEGMVSTVNVDADGRFRIRLYDADANRSVPFGPSFRSTEAEALELARKLANV